MALISHRRFCVGMLVTMLLISCSTRGPSGFFGKKSLHEQYADRITQAGLKESAMGKLWFTAAENSLKNPLQVTLPYSETGYFSQERPSAVAFIINAKRGRVINIQISRKPTEGFSLYLDIWQASKSLGENPGLLAFADTTLSLKYEVKEDGNYIVRIQPELLKTGEYTLVMTTAPSLAFPFSPNAKASIASFWGAERDRGARKHEGVDILAPLRTPLLAASDGIITTVNENTLGGKTLWLRPTGKDYVLYHAHLDEQLVSEGSQVKTGDTVGLVGTTGNAKGGPPHLHFGIYANGGAIDPFAFIDPNIPPPIKIRADAKNIGKLIRTKSKSADIYQQPLITTDYAGVEANGLLRAEAAAGNWYRVSGVNGLSGYINSGNVTTLDNPVRSYKLPLAQNIYDQPDSTSPKKATEKKAQMLAYWLLTKTIILSARVTTMVGY